MTKIINNPTRKQLEEFLGKRVLINLKDECYIFGIIETSDKVNPNNYLIINRNNYTIIGSNTHFKVSNIKNIKELK